ncbi:MAG: putative dsRNA-binding protein, partial [Alkalispirochaetaceae bacterium]
QKEFKAYPRYILEKKTGPDHNKTFWMDVEVDGTSYGPGQGKNKKEAEQEAAKVAYERLTDEADSRQRASRRGRKKR